MDKGEIQNLIKELIEKITVKLNGIDIEEENSQNTWFRVEIDQPEHFLERNGEALAALNHLVRRIAENRISEADRQAASFGSSPRILIDINNFQKKRVDNVRTVAHMMSERARYFKSNIEIDPMTSFERRIVHEFLSNMPDLKTESIGFGPSRRVVIKYIGTT